VAAIKYRVNAADLKRANKLFSQVLFPGTRLKLPSGATLPPPAAAVPGAGAADACGTAAAPHGGAAGRVFDTAGVWDGEAGFMSLKAGAAEACGAPGDGDAPCTWVGTLFSPAQDCAVACVSFNVRLVEGDALAFRLVVAGWEEDGGAQRPATAAQDDVSQGGWFTPAANVAAAVKHVAAPQAAAKPPAADTGGAGLGALLYCSEVVQVQATEGRSEQVYQKIEFQLPVSHADAALKGVPVARDDQWLLASAGAHAAPSGGGLGAGATEAKGGGAVRVCRGQTGWGGLGTEGGGQGGGASAASGEGQGG